MKTNPTLKLFLVSHGYLMYQLMLQERSRFSVVTSVSLIDDRLPSVVKSLNITKKKSMPIKVNLKSTQTLEHAGRLTNIRLRKIMLNNQKDMFNQNQNIMKKRKIITKKNMRKSSINQKSMKKNSMKKNMKKSTRKNMKKNNMRKNTMKKRIMAMTIMIRNEKFSANKNT